MTYQMNRDPSQLRQQIRRLAESLAEPLQKLLAERGPLRRGSFVTLHRKCGKANCHCAGGEGHAADYLSLREEGRTRLRYVPAGIRPRVAEQAGRYRRFRQQRAILTRLVRTLLARIDELARTLETPEPISSARTRREPKRRPGRSG